MKVSEFVQEWLAQTALRNEILGYEVKCDETNNSEESIARGEIHATITLKLQPSQRTIGLKP